MIIDKLIFHKHLEEGEAILYAVHKHWVDMLKPTLEIALFGFVLPWTLYLIGFNSLLFFWISVAWSVLAYGRFLYILVDWYSDVWLITNMSIIVIEWNGIFSNNATRLGYEDIEGAAYEISGFWGTILRYGNMTLRVMSGSHMELQHVANPKRAELSIVKYQGQFMNEREMQDTGALKTLLSNLVARHNREGK